jgi:2-iminobutanoate/2-iminopropanoate deaminase
LKLTSILTGTLLALSCSVVQANALYRAAVQAGPFLYVSGQNAQHKNETLKGNVTQQTNAALKMLGATLKQHGDSFKNVVDVDVFLAKQKDFAAFNKAYHHYFPNKPARSTSLGVLHQNKGALVEIALVAYNP